MNVPLEWVWENDPKELPDDDHARCIAAPGERFLACGRQLFALTTRRCTNLSEAHRGPGEVCYSTLQIEYLGLDWARGLAQKSWGSDPFAVGPLGGEARQAAGLTLLAALAGALAASSTTRDGPSSLARVEPEGPGQPLRPAGWPTRGRAARTRRPSLLPLAVGRAGDLR